MFLPPEPSAFYCRRKRRTVAANRVSFRLQRLIYTAPWPCGASIQAALPWSSSARGSQIYGSVLLYWADKSASWEQLLYIQETAVSKNAGSTGIIIRELIIPDKKNRVNGPLFHLKSPGKGEGRQSACTAFYRFFFYK